MRSAHSLCAALTAILLPVLMLTATGPLLADSETPITEGRLDALDSQGAPLGSCPLKHTDVKVDIAGFVARVTVRQQFQNPFPDKIEAVYVFPLSQDAAVDRMTMKVGDRVIQGEIKERGEARAIYESAKAQGQVASLLDQQRPNIFTQSVANIEPGEQVDITIAYSETLDWKDGEFRFDFPMVVGPRYMPGAPTGAAGTGWSPPTDQVPDANRISPPVTPEGTRAGHDISVRVELDAGLPLRRIDSKQHAVTVEYARPDRTRAVIELKQSETIPNQDFVLVYETSSDEIEDTVLTHTDDRGKFFTLVLQPPKRVRQQLIVPKEIVFVIDKSGSMRGFPIETAKQAMRLCIEGLHENDTFNLMTFSGGVGFCFSQPVPNTKENRQKALDFLGSLQGSGGTEMMKAIHACLAGQDDPERVRVVCFMTDGYVGNDMAIIDAVGRNAGIARVFSFGIGRSVNRFLLDGIARAGRGEVHYILDERQAVGSAERFYERVRTPVLTDVELDFGDLQVEELYPARVPDLFSSKPVVVKGRYRHGGRATITLRGKTGEGDFQRKIDVTLPEQQPANEVLASLWARAKVDHLMGQDLAGIQGGNPNPAIKEEILGLGLRYQLLTQFTSFVAVEQVRITAGGQPRTVAVPVEMPEGVSYEGVFGSTRGRALGQAGARASFFAGRSAGTVLRKPEAAAPASVAGKASTFGLAPVNGPAAQTPMMAEGLSKRLDAMEKDGESEEAKKAVREQIWKLKLAPELQGLAEKVAQQGTDGNLKIGKIEVKAGRVEIRVQLAALSDAVVEMLKKLGFKELGRAKSVKLLIGTIDVGKLRALAELAEVRRVMPAG
ncbi:MAG: VWA domain-containing protein [Pirellulales bacterium]|nr:VWA domain-containing protein [Pirellulales bacterium]